MSINHTLNNGIPISISLSPLPDQENLLVKRTYDKKRLFTISAIAVIIAICVSFVAKLLVYLIDLFTNIAFYGHVSIQPSSPANHTYGIAVVIIPVIGGLIVGLMAYYGSKAIRGHGIPEAMEQILTNQSKINPSITLLKPLSAAISIGTGGPFGAEGPIIATGGALGSTLGQLLKITHNERKILLAAGATAGMAAIFGSPIAAIFLAIELLLFEFSPRSVIPVALACVIGAVGHHLLFKKGVVFPMNAPVKSVSGLTIGLYGMMGVIIGLLAILVTKAVYYIEDGFERLPFHWAWWPSIGGLAVGVIGYFAPRTLGVGYNNIIDVISGTMSLQLLWILCLLKFLSWAIALGSGTSGGTLAPLLTIGGAAGALLGSVIVYWFPASGITISLSALVGMSAMFAGASRAFLTSIVFALETTGQYNALLPLLATCTASYFVSYFVMENTIMTEKIARRGIKTPHSYEPDILEKITIEQVIQSNPVALSAENTISEIVGWLKRNEQPSSDYFIVVTDEGELSGIVSRVDVYSNTHGPGERIDTLIKREFVSIAMDRNLRTAIEMMANEHLDALAVTSGDSKSEVVGIVSYKDILAAYSDRFNEHETANASISLKRRGLKIWVHGQKLLTLVYRKNSVRKTPSV